MQDSCSWTPTKYLRTSRGLRANRRYVAPSSILAADITARFFEKAIPTFAKGDLLDLGCGTAPLYGTYSEFVDSTTCVDWPGSAHDSIHVDVFHDLSKFPYPLSPTSFDTVIISDVLEHLPDPQQALTEVARCCRAGASVLISVPFLYRPHEVPNDFWRFTEWGLRRLVENAGMRTIEIEAYGGPIAVGLDVIGKSLAVVGSRLEKLGGALQRGASRLLVDKSNGGADEWLRADNMPISYSLVAEVTPPA